MKAPRLPLSLIALGVCLCVTETARAGINVSYPPVRGPQFEQDTNTLKNFHWVSATLARGAQPSVAGLEELDRRGFKTIVNLRGFHSDSSSTAEGTHIRFMTWHAEDEDVVRFLKVVTDPTKGPVFVHCMHGSDRTGTMVAMYRMAVQGWNRQVAIEEMINGGYGFHPQWKNLVRYLEQVDVEQIKREAGILQDLKNRNPD